MFAQQGQTLLGGDNTWVGDQIQIPRVVITFFSFFSSSFSKVHDIKECRELPSLCNVVSSINFLFLISPGPYLCIFI